MGIAWQHLAFEGEGIAVGAILVRLRSDSDTRHRDKVRAVMSHSEAFAGGAWERGNLKPLVPGLDLLSV